MAGGISNLVDAFTGGSQYELDAFNRQMQQMVGAGTREAALAKKLAEAEIVRDQLSNRQALGQGGWGGPNEEMMAVLAGLGEERHLGRRTRAQDAALGIAGGMSGTDALNAFIGVDAGRMMTPENIAIQGQAQAAINKDVASAGELNAQAAGHRAGAGKDIASTGKIRAETEQIGNPPASNFTLTRDQNNLLSGWGVPGEDGEIQELNFLPAFYAYLNSPDGAARGGQGAFAHFVSELAQGRIVGPVGQQQSAAAGEAGETKGRRRLLYDTDTGKFSEKAVPEGITAVMP